MLHGLLYILRSLSAPTTHCSSTASTGTDGNVSNCIEPEKRGVNERVHFHHSQSELESPVAAHGTSADSTLSH